MSETEDMIEIDSEESLENIVENNNKVIIDFFADWCGPCDMMEDTVEEIANETEAVVAEVNIEDHQHIAADFGVQSIPTYIFYEDEEIKDQLIGYQDKEDMIDILDD